MMTAKGSSGTPSERNSPLGPQRAERGSRLLARAEMALASPVPGTHGAFGPSTGGSIPLDVRIALRRRVERYLTKRRTPAGLKS
jgi:hypothetical protein